MMGAKTEDFSIFLTSRVKRYGNKPSDFEVRFPSPIELQGSEWDVGLLSMYYNHSWYSIHRDMEIGVIIQDPPELTQRTRREADDGEGEQANKRSRRDLDMPEEISLNAIREQQQDQQRSAPPPPPSTQTGGGTFNAEELNRQANSVDEPSVSNQGQSYANEKDDDFDTPFKKSVQLLRERLQIRESYIKFTRIQSANHTNTSYLVTYIAHAINEAAGNELNLELDYNPVKRRAKIRSRRKIVYLVAEYEHSFLYALGLETTDTENQLGRPVQVEFRAQPQSDQFYYGKREVNIRKFSGIYVYTDIIEHSLVVDSLVPCLGYAPITTDFGQLGEFYQNPPIYHRVNRTSIPSIHISLRTHTGELLPMVDGETTIHLHFRRRFRI